MEHVYFDSYDELMTTLMTGGNATIDAVVLSQNYTQYFHEQGLLADVDPTKVPNYEGISDTYKDIYPYAVDEDGNVFAFPWTAGQTSIAYNPEYVEIEIKHWSDLLDPSLAGHVCMFGDYGGGMIIGALISGQDPSDPESLDLDKVAAALEQLKPQILSFWSSNDEQLMPYYAGEFWAGNMWSGPYAQLVSEGTAVEYVHPEAGTVGFLDYWCVVEGTDQYDLAREWINWIESYELQYTMSTGEGSDYAAPEGETYPIYTTVHAEVLNNLTRMLASDTFWPLLGRSLLTGLMVTGICIAAAYPSAWAIAKVVKPKHRNTLMMMVILPFFTSQLLRIYAMMNLIQSGGVIGSHGHPGKLHSLHK